MNIMPKTISSKLRGGVELSSTSGDVDDGAPGGDAPDDDAPDDDVPDDDAPDDDAPDDVDDDAAGAPGKSQ